MFIKIIIIILIILVLYFWIKSRQTKESLCLCSGPQIYREERPKDYALFENPGVYTSTPFKNYKGMPYDIETNGGYVSFGQSC